jgi:biotin operon repressor
MSITPPSTLEFLRSASLHGKPLPLAAFRVGAWMIGRGGGAVQSQAVIAHQCGLSVTTVRKALADLTEAGYLVKTARRNGGQVADTAYVMTVPGL